MGFFVEKGRKEFMMDQYYDGQACCNKAFQNSVKNKKLIREQILNFYLEELYYL